MLNRNIANFIHQGNTILAAQNQISVQKAYQFSVSSKVSIFLIFIF